MDATMHREMTETVKELKDFVSVAGKLADKVASMRFKIGNWQNVMEDAEKKARAALAELEKVKAEQLLQLNHVPSELAPLKRRMEDDSRRATQLLAEAEKSKKAADEKMAQVEALLAKADAVGDKFKKK
jgi:hypothetical protein